MKLTASNLRKIIVEEVEIERFRRNLHRELHEMYDAGFIVDDDLMNERAMDKIKNTILGMALAASGLVGGAAIQSRNADIDTAAHTMTSTVKNQASDLKAAMKAASKANLDKYNDVMQPWRQREARRSLNLVGVEHKEAEPARDKAISMALDNLKDPAEKIVATHTQAEVDQLIKILHGITADSAR